ncbi:drug/metabolite transporter (DMT)-like permease [Paucibacter oligotrophus]|uniref:Drug/metabolite transporter (DMT)-like permease n=1 Tax=Roseateles oligotrophus TaxID=1769250 RepID=A0A840LHZ2_9BURK|nr:DMT family transporter [Roseateles oligotrophus]MBB4845818.1 drug/metabolite transporter (DMT)-like permease [Roseateles oligotrophus]
MTSTASHLPALKGGLLALLAAALFGVSTPLVQKLGLGLGPFTTSALLYAGAALVGALLRRPVEKEARLRRSDLPRLLAVALFGALIAPVAMAWGLQRSSGTGASLLLTLEALFTAVLAWRFYGETMDRRVWSALLLLLAGGITLVLDQGQGGGSQLWGLLAVLLATAAWGMDNSLSRALAERDPAQVVLAKALLGASATGGLAWLSGEALPGWGPALGLLAVGATGYGLSLRFYLLAQRAFGAARTGSVFAFAPFIGAALALALGDRSGGWGLLLGGGLMLAGVLVHLAESHEHEHAHEALEHEHAHTHDDGHHDHEHEPMPAGPHSHPHRHPALRHKHAHVPDLHHRHTH